MFAARVVSRCVHRVLVTFVSLLFAASLHAADVEIAPPKSAGETLRASDAIVASDGERYLAVWYGNGALRARHLDAEGRPVLRELVVGSDPAWTIAGNGRVWMVNGTLVEGESAHFTGIRGAAFAGDDGFLVDRGLSAAIVKENGSVISLPHEAVPDGWIGAAWGEDVYAVAGSSDGQTRGIAVNFFDRDGAPRFAAPKVLLAADYVSTVRVARIGGAFLAVAARVGNRGLVLARFDEQGVLLGEPIELGGNVSYLNVVQAGDDDAILTWRGYFDQDQWFLRYSCGVPRRVPLGVFASNGQSLVHLESGSSVVAKPAVVRGGTLACDPAAMLAQPAVNATISFGVPQQHHPRVAVSATRAVAFWTETALATRIAGRALTHDVQLLDEIAFPEPLVESAAQIATGIASDGSGFVAVWHEVSEDAHVVRAMKLDGASPAVTVGLGAIDPGVYEANRLDGSASIVWSGSHYVVAWSDSEQKPRVARLTANGVLLDAVLDGGGVRIPLDLQYEDYDHHRKPRVYANGDELLLLWTASTREWVLGPHPEHVLAMRLSNSGEPLEREPMDLGSAGNQSYGGVAAWRAPFWYVFWLDSHWPYDAHRVRRVTRYGRILDGDFGADPSLWVPPPDYAFGWSPVVVRDQLLLFGGFSGHGYQVIRRDATWFHEPAVPSSLESVSVVAVPDGKLLAVGRKGTRLFSSVFPVSIDDPGGAGGRRRLVRP